MKRIISVLLLTLAIVVVAVHIMFERHKKREIGDREACLGNLLAIDVAKDSYVEKYGKTNGWCWQSDEEAFRDLIEKEKIIPYYSRCPKSKVLTGLSNTVASYSVNAIGESPACKFHLHTLDTK